MTVETDIDCSEFWQLLERSSGTVVAHRARGAQFSESDPLWQALQHDTVSLDRIVHALVDGEPC